MAEFTRIPRFPEQTNGKGLFSKMRVARVIGENALLPRVNHTCEQRISVSLFFDGTNNHRSYHKSDGSYTNVARLFEACEGMILNPSAAEADQATGTREPGRYRAYLQGVGTPFPEINEHAFTPDGKAHLRSATPHRPRDAFSCAR